MNRSDIIVAIAAKSGLTHRQATRALREILDAIARALMRGDKVVISQLGTFSTGKRHARTGRNPKTGKPLRIRAPKVAHFKPAKRLTVELEDEDPDDLTENTGPRVQR